MEPTQEKPDEKFIRKLKQFAPEVNALEDKHSFFRQRGLFQTSQQTKDFIAQNAGKNLSRRVLIFNSFFKLEAGMIGSDDEFESIMRDFF